MTSAVVGSARIEITGDLNQFAAKAEADIRSLFANLSASADEQFAAITSRFSEAGGSAGQAYTTAAQTAIGTDNLTTAVDESATNASTTAADKWGQVGTDAGGAFADQLGLAVPEAGVAGVAEGATAAGATATDAWATVGQDAGDAFTQSTADALDSGTSDVQDSLATMSSAAADSASDFGDAGAEAGDQFSSGASDSISAGGAGLTEIPQAIDAGKPLAIAAATSMGVETGEGAVGAMKEKGTEAGHGFIASIHESLKGLGSTIFAGVGLFGGAELIKSSIAAADDAEAQARKVQHVFGDAGETVKTFSEGATKSLRITASEAQATSSAYGQFFHSLGLSGKPAADLSDTLTSITANVADFNNVSQESVQSTFDAALKGRVIGLKQYGIEVDNSTLAEEAMKHGIVGVGAELDKGKIATAQARLATAQDALNKLTNSGKASTLELAAAHDKVVAAQAAVTTAETKHVGTLSAEQKGMAAYYTIVDKTRAQQHSLADSADTARAHQAEFAVQIDELKTRLGTALIPILADVTGILVQDVVPAFIAVGHIVQENRAWLIPLVAVVGGAVAAMVAIKIATSAYSAAVRTGESALKAYRAGVGAVNSVLEAMGLKQKTLSAEQAAATAKRDLAVNSETAAQARLTAAQETYNAAMTEGTVTAAELTAAQEEMVAAQTEAAAAAEEMAVAEGELDVAMDANPIGVIVIALGALAAGFAYAWTHSETFRHFIIAMWDAVKASFKVAWDFIKTVFAWIGDHWKIVVDVVLGPLGLLLTNWRTVWGAIQAVYNAVIKPVFDAIGKAAGVLWTILKGSFALISGGFHDLWRIMQTTWTAVGAPVFGAVTTGARHLGDGLKWVYDHVIAPVVHSIEYVFGHLGTAWHDLWAGMANIGGGILAGIVSALNLIIALINAGIRAVDWVIDRINNMSGGLSDLWTWTGAPGIPKIPDIPQIPSVHGTGGDLTLGWNVVGDRGPELIYNDGQRQSVLSNADSMAKLAGGGVSGGSGLNTGGGLSDDDRELLWALANRPVSVKVNGREILAASNNASYAEARR